MEDKRPYNEQGHAHGYWECTWYDGGWYKGNYINGVEFGLYEVNLNNMGETDNEYYAR